MTLRVLHAHSGNLFGGIERILLTLPRHDDASVEHTFALTHQARLAQELAALGAAVHDLGPARWSRPWTVRRTRRRLRRVIADCRPNVVMLHSPWGSAVFGAALPPSLPLAVWLHHAPTGRHWLERLAARLEPRVVVCNSHFTASSASVMYPRATREVVYPPVPAPRPAEPGTRAALRASLGCAEGDTVIVQVSRMEAWKGQRTLIDALGRMRDLEGWRAWIVGGPQRARERAFQHQLARRVRALGLVERMQLLGERRDVPAILAAADIFCQPNLQPEPFGIVFIEALYAGLPVVTSDVGGGAEIVDPTCGRLTTPGDVDGVADCLRDLVRDGPLRALLGSRGPGRATLLCDPDRQVQRLHAVLRAAAAH